MGLNIFVFIIDSSSFLSPVYIYIGGAHRDYYVLHHWLIATFHFQILIVTITSHRYVPYVKIFLTPTNNALGLTLIFFKKVA